MNRMYRMNMHCSSCTDFELPIAVWGNFTKTLKVTMHNLEKCTWSELLFELSFTCNIHLRQGTSSPSPALESGGRRRWRATHAPTPCARKCQEMSVKRNGTSSFRARMLRPKPKSGFNLQLTWQSVELKLWFSHDLFSIVFETSTQENHLPISATHMPLLCHSWHSISPQTRNAAPGFEAKNSWRKRSRADSANSFCMYSSITST